METIQTTQAQSGEETLAKTQQQEAEEKRPFNEVLLSDGRIATIRRPKGRDAQNAERLVKPENQIAFAMALASQVTTINGVGVIFEDMLDWPLDDCENVVAKYKAMGGKYSESPNVT